MFLLNKRTQEWSYLYCEYPERGPKGVRKTHSSQHSFPTWCLGLGNSRDHIPRQIGLPRGLLVSAASETLCLIIAVSGGENAFWGWEITYTAVLLLPFLPPQCKTNRTPPNTGFRKHILKLTLSAFTFFHLSKLWVMTSIHHHIS